MRKPRNKREKSYPFFGRAVVMLAGLSLSTVLCLSFNFPGGSAKAQTDNQISPAGMQQIAALLAEKASRTPAQQKIDSQLLQR
ncbi:MAG TPA: hypothetical protein VFC63_15395 [Blastocatellia bacterium]|nr:hypothetical protein [Blastocatellia bacterium]